DSVVADASEILLQIPRTAAVGVAQGRHDLDQAGQVAGRLHRSLGCKRRNRSQSLQQVDPGGRLQAAGCRSSGLALTPDPLALRRGSRWSRNDFAQLPTL